MNRHGLAPVRGTSSLYKYLDGGMVLLMKEGYNYFVTKEYIFKDLYYELTESKAAMKEDCIEYVIFSRRVPPYEYPNWYTDAMVDGWIYEDGMGFGGYIFYDQTGEIPMAENSFILKNFKGDLRYMEFDEFERYYEFIGG